MRYYSIQIQGAPSLNAVAPAAPASNDWTHDAGIDCGNLPDAGNTPQGGNITLNKPSTPVATPTTSISGQLSSVVNGVNDPGALDIEIDIFLKAGGSDAPSQSHVTIYGIPISWVSQASQFTGKNIKIYGGYTNGLPLANEQVKNQGLLVDGQIWPSYGNWISNNTSICFVIKPSDSGQGGPTDPKNIVHNMPTGTLLSTAIKNALTTAFPNSNVNVNISSSLKLTYPDWSFHQSLDQYMAYCKSLSHSILGTPSKTGYAGVTGTMQGSNISVVDGTVKGGVIQINYDDLVGQPTWIGLNKIQVFTLLRGDISISASSSGIQQIKLPPTLTTITEVNALLAGTQGNSIPGLSGNYLTFQGTWDVQSVRHIGRFRDPQWNAWMTIIEASQSVASGSSTPPGPGPQTGGQSTFVPAPNAPPGSGVGVS
jgi:hypothetical protein